MRDFLKDGNFTSIKLSDSESKIKTDPKTGEVISQSSSFIWTSDKINDILQKYNDGLVEIKGMSNSPFFTGDIELHVPHLPEEQVSVFEHKANEIISKNSCRIMENL